MKKYIACILLTLINLNYANDLDELAIQFNTDKGPQDHNYTKIYDRLFSSLKNDSISFLEIGFFHGQSARMWDAYFKNAKNLDFIDITHNAYSHFYNLSDRCTLSMVNQEIPEELSNFMASRTEGYDIIIDDGGHTMNQQIVSFKCLFPYLKKGGIYIIEDLHTAYFNSFGGLYSSSHNVGSEFKADMSSFGHVLYKNSNTIQFLQDMIHYVNYRGARTWCADINKTSESITNEIDSLYRDIESIQFYNSLCIIRKF